MTPIILRKDGIGRFNGSVEWNGAHVSVQVDARGDGWDSPAGSKFKAFAGHYGATWLERWAETGRDYDDPAEALVEVNRLLAGRGFVAVRCIPFYPDRCSEIGCDIVRGPA